MKSAELFLILSIERRRKLLIEYYRYFGQLTEIAKSIVLLPQKI
jgi:hypothetical protein